MYGFPKGEKPGISLMQAAHICEIIAKKANIKEFNPMEAILFGGKTPESGAWNFLQYGKDGKAYRFIIAFPEDVCLIFDEGKFQSPVSAFKRDGTPIKWPQTPQADRKNIINGFDVFDELERRKVDHK